MPTYAGVLNAYTINILIMDLNEILFHTGEERERYFNAVAPPVIQSSNFAFQDLDRFRQAVVEEMDAHLYSRGNNPTVNILRQKMAALCGTEDALLFGSGSAAVAAAILSCVQAGDHMICVERPYSWTQQLIDGFLQRFGVSCSYVDAREINAIEAAVRPNTRLLMLESPNSLTFELQDLRACAALARQYGLMTCIDNSCASPLFQRPAELGIDLIVHAVTKYINGHSDVMAGCVAGPKTHLSKLFQQEYMALGAMLSPHDAALVLRGLRTLPLRLHRSQESTTYITEQLAAHPGVQRVLYPFHPDFPQYELARRQMRGAGGLFSIVLDIDNLQQAEAFFYALNHFLLAASWGGHESLVLPSVAFHKMPGRADSPVPFQLVRFYIGLEDAEWLWADIAQALDQMLQHDRKI